MFCTMGVGLRDLRVWQEAVGLGADVIRSLRHTNRREIKAITEHTMVTAMLMAEHVAEGYGRYAAGEQRQFYRAAKRDLLRLETSLAVARQAVERDLLHARRGEQRQFYRAAKRDLLRLETSLAVARQADLLSVAHHAQLATRIQTVSRLLSGFLVYLDRQIAGDKAS